MKRPSVVALPCIPMLASFVFLGGGCAAAAYEPQAYAPLREAAPAADGPTTPAPGSPGAEAAAKPSPVTPPVDPAAKPAAEARQVVYSAAYRVVVADVAGTLAAIQSSAERLGGYLQEVAGGSITVRVPAAKFTDACKAVETAGEVVDRQVKAQDVTEEMRDLAIRLANAEKMRERLLAILAKAEKVEDALKVEAELARVSGEIDQAKGKIRFMESRLAMSTVRVDLNAAVAQNARGATRLPFAWIEQLGDGLVAGQVQQAVRRAGFLSRGPTFAPPAEFVRYFEDADEADAMDAGGLLLRVLMGVRWRLRPLPLLLEKHLRSGVVRGLR